MNSGNMAWTGRGGSSGKGTWDSFRGPDGREVRVDTTNVGLAAAQRAAYKEWKKGAK